MEKNFDFQRAEAEINKRWLDDKTFKATVGKKTPFTIIMPPPNITSRLHIGHAFDLTIQDAIIRFKRMQGFEALLVPGADHAAIATEVKVIEELKRQGIEKKDLSKQEFLVHVEEWYKVYTSEITDQMKRLGLSADWSRFAFTMDEPRKRAVKEAFHRLHSAGLIYKGEHMTNWCMSCDTATSDIEVEHITKQQTLYTIKFGEVNISTVRPEVIFGDAAIAVHPKDKRYEKMIGKMVKIPLTDKKIPIIKDDSVDMKFGTGALQITPANSHVDYEIAIKHGLEIPRVTLRPRQDVVNELRSAGLIISEKKHQSNVGVCYRCKTAIEPKLSNQWFVKMQDLAKKAIEDRPQILPKKFEKIYLHWLKNIKDWCISRQLASGHPIPIEGETDVLDTWFSSALWPFSVFDNRKDFDFFYPTQVLVTGYDILFFWVIRMIFSGQFHTGKLPFNTVLLHGIVRDKNGIKMSKSLGNGIDPLEIINEFGADALRFSLLYGTKFDRDPRYSLDRATLARNFINKIWNATKFYKVLKEDSSELTIADKWILTKFNTLVKTIIRKFEKFDFGTGCVDLQNFFWSDFCDVYLEQVKKQGSGFETFKFILFEYLKLLHPIMPYLTEELSPGISVTSFPKPGKNFPKEKREFDVILEREREARAKLDEEANRIKKIEYLKKEIARSEGMLGNKNFVERAPKKLVDEERAKLEDNKKNLKAYLNPDCKRHR